MPQVIFTQRAYRDLERLRDFLEAKSPAAAKRAAQAIFKSIQRLEMQPKMGRPADDIGEDYRELIIGFGDSGYLAIYRCEGEQVIVVAIQHQKELGQGLS